MPVDHRACSEHPATRAQDRCDRCDRPFCAACLRDVGRWRACDACLAWLERERRGRPLGERLRALLPSLLAAGALGALMVGGMLAIGRGTGGATSAASLVGTAGQVGCLERQPDRSKLYVVGGLPLHGYPPAHLILENCAFRPRQAVLLEGSVFGYDDHGQPFSEQLGPVTTQAATSGVLTATVDIPDHTRFEGSYQLRITAIGHEGSNATASLSAEGNTVPPTHTASS